MIRTLGDHIMSLELRLQGLRAQLTRPTLSDEERARIEAQMQTAQLALSRYREAYELEQKIA